LVNVHRELQTLRRLFSHALASTLVAGCGGSNGSAEPPAADSGGGFQCQSGYLVTTVQPYVPHCVDASASSDAGDSGDSPDSAANGDAGCVEEPFYCERYCPVESGLWFSGCQVLGDAGARSIECNWTTLCGRKTEGQIAPPAIDAAPGSWLAAAAWLEASSVEAFERLAAELSRYGAPRSLIREARRSARDEVRHALIMRRLALAHGAKSLIPDRAKGSRRSLVRIALENATEGCVRETFGALVAMHQARNAADRSVCAAMRAIARDETRHAALAWSIDRWIQKRASPSTRRRIERARNAEIARLAGELLQSPSEAQIHVLGVPSAVQARALLAIVAGGFRYFDRPRVS